MEEDFNKEFQAEEGRRLKISQEITACQSIEELIGVLQQYEQLPGQSKIWPTQPLIEVLQKTGHIFDDLPPGEILDDNVHQAATYFLANFTRSFGLREKVAELTRLKDFF